MPTNPISSRPTTTPGEQGWISGGPKDSVELIYSGNGRFEVLGYQGSLTIH